MARRQILYNIMERKIQTCFGYWRFFWICRNPLFFLFPNPPLPRHSCECDVCGSLCSVSFCSLSHHTLTPLSSFSVFLCSSRSLSSYVGLRSFVTNRMESLQHGRLILHHMRSSSPPPQQTQFYRNPRPIKQLLGFRSLLNRATKNANLRSLPSDTNGGAAASQDGSFPFEEETHHQHNDDRALVLAREVDDFGYLVGFRLIPDSGWFCPFFFISSFVITHTHTHTHFIHVIKFSPVKQ